MGGGGHAGHIGHGHHGHHHHIGMHNRHMFHHGTYNRRTHNNFGHRPGPTVIYVPGNNGGIWIPRHRVFKSEMRMWIELMNNQVSYNVGDWVHGRVLCNFQEPFTTNTLVLSFSGLENTWLPHPVTSDNKNLMYQQQWVLWQNDPAQFMQEGGPILQPGQFVFPFSFQIPFNLPPTIYHNNGDVRLDYKIRAQFIPHLANDWVDPGATLSCLRANDFYINVHRQLDQVFLNPECFSYTLKTVAHAFLGMGKTTETNTTFQFQQNMATGGSQISCRIICDNSHCNKHVDKFLFKWYCLTTFRTQQEAQMNKAGVTQKSPALLKMSFPGVKSGQKLDQVVMLDVPKAMVPSIHCMLFTIGYVVQIQTIHDIFGKVFIQEKNTVHNVFIQVPPPAGPIVLDQQYVMSMQQQPLEWHPQAYDEVQLGTVVDQIQKDKEGYEESKEETKEVKTVDTYITGDQKLLESLALGVNTGCWQKPPEDLKQMMPTAAEIQQQAEQKPVQTVEFDPTLPALLNNRMARGTIGRNPGAEVARLMGQNALIQPDQPQSEQLPQCQPFHLMQPSQKEETKALYASQITEVYSYLPQSNLDIVLELLVQYQGNVQFVVEHLVQLNV